MGFCRLRSVRRASSVIPCQACEGRNSADLLCARMVSILYTLLLQLLITSITPEPSIEMQAAAGHQAR